MITKEQYEKMLPYETHLRTAKECDYARNVTMEGFRVLGEVYKEIYKRDSGLGGGCGRCQLRALKELAVPYFEFKKELEIVGKELEPINKDVDNQPITKNGRKTSAKKNK